MNNKPGRDLALLVLGLGMLGCGLVLFFKSIHVYASDYAGFGLLGDRFAASGIGVLFIPLILAVVLWVLFPKNIWPKILFWVTIVAMVLYVISLIRVSFRSNMLTTVMYVMLIFIGGALSFKKLVMDDPKRGKDKDNN